MYIGLHVKCPLFFSDFNETLIIFVSKDFLKILVSNLVDIHPLEAELFHADGETDRQTDRHDEANSLFSKFCEPA